jgi:hypothetical protein
MYFRQMLHDEKPIWVVAALTFISGSSCWRAYDHEFRDRVQVLSNREDNGGI